MGDKNSDLYVVGIGASADGLDAIQTLFDNIPNNSGIAFVIIQHLSPDFKSLMPELLSKHTKMPIFTAEDKQTIKPNCIYLNQRNKNLHIKGSELYLLDKGPKNNLNLPIDIFFHTLGEEYKERSVGVILSGTGSDGSRGIRTIKEGNGTIIVQDPITAQFDGMPNSAISTNLADYVLSPVQIAALFQQKPIKHKIAIDLDTHSSNEALIDNILDAIYKFSGINFKEYKKNTLLRRLEKRMNIKNIHQLYDYLTYLKSNDEEKQILKDDFLIGVTRFFRDKEAFSILNQNVIAEICKSKKNAETIRVWIAACSTGEEVYSIAILIDDYIRTNNLGIDFKIFATDIDPKALAIASIGAYHVNIVSEIDKSYLDRYFLRTGNKIQIIKRLREKIVFSNHNLIKDPPFIRMDLISCRNLLIYFDNKVQKKVMYNFQFALNKYGYLFLGNSETLGEVSKLYKTIDVKWKIFQNISSTKHIPSQNNSIERVSTLSYKTPFESLPTTSFHRDKENPELIFHKYLSKKYSPASIFIDENYNILFIKGDAGKRLMHKEGVFQNNLLNIVHPDVASIIRNGVRRLNIEKKSVSIKGVTNKTTDNTLSFDLTFHKPNKEEGLSDCYLIEFSNDKAIDLSDSIVINNVNLNAASSQRLEDLENELKFVKTELQNAIEELETSNEELQSSNEELMASNEELQSTNEELQSVNEELYTVNSELQEKNTELTNLSNDVTNLLDNTDIATLFLDTDLRIRKFTPALKQVFSLRETDLGRPLSSFTSNFNEETREAIIKDSELVLKKLITVEKQLKDKFGNFYLQRISPFITASKNINGVVITLDNINKLKEIEKELAQTERRYHRVFENLSEGFIQAKAIINDKNRIIDWEIIDVNQKFEEIFNLKEKLIGLSILDLEPYTLTNIKNWISTFEKTALTEKDHFIENFTTKNNKHYYVHLFSPGENEIAATFTDVTELKNQKEALTKSEAELTRVQSLAEIGSWYLDLKTNEVEWTKELYKIFDWNHKLPPPNLKETEKILAPKSWITLNNAIANTLKTGKPYEIELNLRTKKNENTWIWARGETVKDENGIVIALRGAAQNITKSKSAEQEIIAAKKNAELANAHKNYFLANMSHEIRTPMNGVLGFSELLKNDQLSTKDRLKYLEIIDSNSKQLLNLIDDIIDIAKIESEEIKILYKPCHLANLVKNLEITYNQLKLSKYKKSDIDIRVVIPEEHKDLVVVTDIQRLQQIVSNLLNNALKFSLEGEISFGFNISKNKINFFVKDQGIGIKEEKQKEIFERFKQVNYDDNANYGGTGLGLAISKGLVNLLGGDMKLQSEYGVGTLFEFTLPLKEGSLNSDKKKVSNINESNFIKDKTILIAEDDSLIQLLFKIVLKNTNANILFANNGKEALDIFKKKKCDLVLLDIRMPEMNGIDALDKIIEINPEAKVIMQTAYAMPEEKEKCFNKGCVGYLTKPVAKEDLFEEINKWIS
ncbi:histidine kinase [Tamlana sedimentorum]|uniref:Histidine kinase n=1 Tax=Neotamlana sedimentorum TaxID=1435349 RepID=A0A0D7WFR6_9FLAO|nr:CheR family methyltransferase [Tamlana sedimentorum]KJD36587.1 histidine kinase [Tamlana sedimentorum]